MKAISYIIVFWLAAQIVSAQENVVNVQTVLSVNETTWSKDSELTASLTVTNTSPKSVKISLPPSFILEKHRADYSRTVWGDEFSSIEKDEDLIILKKTENTTTYKIRQFFTFSLDSNESKTVEFNLSKLGWNARMSSIWTDRSWFNAVPKGNYNLYYLWSHYENEESDKGPVIKINSNKITVKLNSEK